MVPNGCHLPEFDEAIEKFTITFEAYTPSQIVLLKSGFGQNSMVCLQNYIN